MKSLQRLDPVGIAFVLVWSSGYVVGGLSTRTMDPLAVTLWRFALSGAILAALALVRRERWPSGRALVRLAALGVPMFAVQFGALYTAMAAGLPAGTAALIMCSAPLVVAVVSAAAGWERLTSRQWVGIALGVAGVAVTLSDRVGRPPSAATLVWVGVALAGLAIGTTLQSKVHHDAGPAATASVQVMAAAAVMAAWAPVAGPVSLPVHPADLGTMAWLVVITGVGAPLLLFALIRRHGATRASALLFPVPAVTAVASWPVLGTPIGSHTVAGLAIVGVALWLARRRTGVASQVPAAARFPHAGRPEETV